MQIHQRGYVSEDPRIKPAAGYGVNRPAHIPDVMDVLIVGTGPAAVTAAAQLSQYSNINTRIIERRDGRLMQGQADGIQARSVETFQAFGFATEIVDEAYRNVEMCFWKPDPANPGNIVRTSRVPDDAHGMSEFPHIYVNQSRVLDYFIRAAKYAPARVEPDYGLEFVDCTIDRDAEYPVAVTLRRTTGADEGAEFVVRTRYLVGGDGARSKVRAALGHKLHGKSAMHVWGVLDVLANTDFPDFQIKCSIQSATEGNILLIPREGGYLSRLYVDLGEKEDSASTTVSDYSVEFVIEKANRILKPYSLDVKEVTWWSVYEVAHRITDGFDDVPDELRETTHPRAFIMGDACHTHSAKAGQGMNVSIQDGWNLSWKLAHVLTGLAPESLLSTYAAERKTIAQNLIDFDKEWSDMMAKPVESWDDPDALAKFYESTMEFPAGFMTQYPASMIIGNADRQNLAQGFPIGKRFKSAEVIRRADNRWRQLGHLHEADGRWRVYVFADQAAPALFGTKAADFANWWETSNQSPRVKITPANHDSDSIFDLKVVYQQDYTLVEPGDVPSGFKPIKQPLGLRDINQVFCSGHGRDIFEERGISREGAVVVVRPDQYVAGVYELADLGGIANFFSENLLLDK